MSYPESTKDRVFSKNRDRIRPFCFDEEVANVFPDMIQRSVPGYSTILDMLGYLCAEHAVADANYYDLGCSLGAASVSMQRNITPSGGQIFAVDNSQAMIQRASAYTKAFKQTTPIACIKADIRDFPMEKAAVVVMNFTLQFLEPSHRQALIANIYNALLPGGLLFLSEKIHFASDTINTRITNQYHAFKQRNGYSALEIAQKRAALENVLRTDTINTHYQRLQKAGFSDVQAWFQHLNFCSIIAIKERA